MGKKGGCKFVLQQLRSNSSVVEFPQRLDATLFLD